MGYWRRRTDRFILINMCRMNIDKSRVSFAEIKTLTTFLAIQIVADPDVSHIQLSTQEFKNQSISITSLFVSHL